MHSINYTDSITIFTLNSSDSTYSKFGRVRLTLYLSLDVIDLVVNLLS